MSSGSEAVTCTDVSPIAVIGFGAILPQADSPAAFWQNVVAGHCSVRPIPPERWNADLYCSDALGIEDKAVTSNAAFIDAAVIEREATTHNLPLHSSNRLQITSLAATMQAVAGVDLRAFAPERVAIYLGCMNVDEALGWERFLIDDGGDLAAHIHKSFPEQSAEIGRAIEHHFQRWKTNPATLRESLFPTSVLALLRKRLGICGESTLVDAACASSLAAMDAGIRALQSGAVDLVITGGIESNLAPYTFVLFSRLGVLARSHCFPFDARSDGMSQGEGAVIFVLQRADDAEKQGHRALGRIVGNGASSDGATTSLFAPYAEGQLSAYEKAYRTVDPADVVYVECHGTGTRIGDETELRSVDRFFQRPLAVGSVKALVGHTKGAAGAVSLLKCLLALEHRTIPPSTYFAEGIVDSSCRAFINRESIAIEGTRPALLGVSSFGFGGINHHLVIEEASAPARLVRRDTRVDASPVVVVGEHSQPTENIRQTRLLGRFALPPRNRTQVDVVQLAALVALDELARSGGIRIRNVDRKRVTVISAGCLCLHQACVLAGRVNHFEMDEALRGWDPDVIAVAISNKERHPPITAASGPGILNNVIAGRVANVFDFTGPTFHVDADFASRGVALLFAQRILERDGGMVIVLSADERYVEDAARIERDAVNCTILASADFALEHTLPITAALESVEYVPA